MRLEIIFNSIMYMEEGRHPQKDDTKLKLWGQFDVFMSECVTGYTLTAMLWSSTACSLGASGLWAWLCEAWGDSQQ